MVTTTRRKVTVRDSEAMRERILAAVGRMIVRDGLAAVGINALAREGGCDKVLIYRYFGDLEGVYSGFAAQGDFWWTVEELTRGIDTRLVPVREATKLILRRHAQAIRSRPMTLAVLAAELVDRTPLVVALETVRERRSLELAKWIGERYRPPRSVDLEAISMLIGVAINYLAVRARKIRVMSGIAIKTDRDWKRILSAIDAVVDGVLREG